MSIDGCVLHSQRSSCVEWVFCDKGGASSKSLNADIFGLGEVQSCNLVQMCSISGAMNECISISVPHSICP